MKGEQIKEILAHFKGKPITQNVLTEYCNLNHFDPIVMSQYEDCVFQQEHDERVAALMPALFAELSKYRDVPTFGTEKERKAIAEANGDIEWQIAKVLEDHGVIKGEISIITGNLAQAFKGIVENAGTRAKNMCDSVLNEIGEEKFGKNMPIKPMAEFYRAKAKELGKKLQETGKEDIVK